MHTPLHSGTHSDRTPSGRPPTVLVTGGAGFIGSALVRALVLTHGYRVITLDKLTYAGNPDSLAEALGHLNHTMVVGDICDAALVRSLLETHRPDGILHLAAESHVDRSIDAPAEFVRTNVEGTLTLLTESRRYWNAREARGEGFRFLHVSTDEVFGSLGETGHFTEDSPYDPSSPYSASKAASDHLARAWQRTFGLPVVITNCSNNYGPYQFPEKLIPLTILSAIEGRPLPVYGTGANVRDWIHVNDHVEGLRLAYERGVPGRTYLLGGEAERNNLRVVERLCDLLDERLERSGDTSCHKLITFVTDRPGHDHRYAVDTTRARNDLGWAPRESFDSGLAATVDWYLENTSWWERVRTGAYRLERLGLGSAE